MITVVGAPASGLCLLLVLNPQFTKVICLFISGLVEERENFPLVGWVQHKASGSNRSKPSNWPTHNYKSLKYQSHCGLSTCAHAPCLIMYVDICGCLSSGTFTKEEGMSLAPADLMHTSINCKAFAPIHILATYSPWKHFLKSGC